MIRRSRNMRYTATAGSTGSDTDALQTDVMRFMSILGLCLMAVFALVQSLPLQETAPVRPEPEQEKLHRDIAIQQERARAPAGRSERLRPAAQAQRKTACTAGVIFSAATTDAGYRSDTACPQQATPFDKLNWKFCDDQLAQGRDELAGDSAGRTAAGSPAARTPVCNPAKNRKSLMTSANGPQS